MHLITVKVGLAVFNRQFFIYLDGPSTGVSVDISRHILLAKREIKLIMIDISVPLIILSSVFR